MMMMMSNEMMWELTSALNNISTIPADSSLAITNITISEYWQDTHTHRNCRLEILIFVHKYCSDILPSKYLNYFDCNTTGFFALNRYNGNLYLFNAKKNCRVNVLVWKVPRYWNLLPVQLKSAPSPGVLKLEWSIICFLRFSLHCTMIKLPSQCY